MQHYKKHHPAIVKGLKAGLKTDKPSGFKDLKKYIGTSYDFVGLSVPKQREIFKAGQTFNTLSLEEQLQVWNEIWLHSHLYEALSQALLFVEKHMKHLEPVALWKVIKNWTPKIDNWAHSDVLSGIYSYLLEQEPKMVYAQLKEWNYSDNPWERRQSLVALIEYSKKRKKVLPFSRIITLVKFLLKDPHYFVQKGLGWALREAGNVYPKETYDFLLKHYKDISGIAFSAAAEKLGKKEKEKLKELRRGK